MTNASELPTETEFPIIDLSDIRTIKLIHYGNGHDGHGYYLSFHISDGDKKGDRFTVRKCDPIWERVEFIDELAEPEVDFKFIPANPLHFGTSDYTILAVRLPRWMEKPFSPQSTE